MLEAKFESCCYLRIVNKTFVDMNFRESWRVEGWTVALVFSSTFIEREPNKGKLTTTFKKN